MKKILYSDREETTQAQQERKDPVVHFTPEEIETVPAEKTPAKKSNAWIWIVISIVVVLIIIGLVYYMNLKKKENAARITE